MFDAELPPTLEVMKLRTSTFLAPHGPWERFYETERALDTIAKEIFSTIAKDNIPLAVFEHRERLTRQEITELLIGADSLGSEFQTVHATVHCGLKRRRFSFQDSLKMLVELFDSPSQLDKFDQGHLGVLRSKLGREGETVERALVRCPDEIEAWAMANADHISESDQKKLTDALQNYRHAYDGITDYIADARAYLEPLGRISDGITAQSGRAGGGR